MADRYTHGHHESVLSSHRWRTVENSCAYLVPHLVPGTRVLDVGCGPATITIDIARRVAPGPVVGIDAAQDAIDAARQASADAGVVNLELRVDDVYAIDAPDEHFDVVHAHQVLQHLSDPVAALAEMRRVCRPGGVVAARDAVYRAMSWYPLDPLLDRWLDLYCAVAESNRGQPDAGSHLKAWGRAAGFAEVTASASVWCYSSPAELTWWGGLWADRVSATQLADQAVGLGIATAEELEAVAEAWRRWATHPDAWFLVPHGEVLLRG